MATKAQIQWAAGLTGAKREYFIDYLAKAIAEYAVHKVTMRYVKIGPGIGGGYQRSAG